MAQFINSKNNIHLNIYIIILLLQSALTLSNKHHKYLLALFLCTLALPILHPMSFATSNDHS
jgi:hypothetical protein